MKNSVYFLAIILVFIISCNTSKSNFPTTEKSVAAQGDTVRIANDELEYEVIIIDPGFNMWLNSRAFQRGYHSQAFLAAKNQLYVMEWNSRVLQPQRYDPNLYEMTINYDPTINYGYEVNYLIYNYMIYFQNTYNQILFGFVPIR
ncbi:hypothetical protein SAMN05444395_104103 [Flavobacterium fryxellicola]|uniref:Lipoprotein n=1 Tax=Flavobacterium fryxellicola TaxID=249352 RepID=A0A167WDB0_9FLAO|nr:DUF6146 family protein [Flavobacterium fryxellicola]OAB27253.1 hypothetical protein FBFR_11990 [Flavobacterium fryxellicola]SHN67323.1 hypothetical protein SAMN05444395_104103 [Flavobacterium fryxellicola]